MNIEETRKRLKGEQLDGWLLYDFRHSNPLAGDFLGIKNAHLTRRLFYWIPVAGDPVLLLSQLETVALPGQVKKYRTFQELEGHLKTFLKSGMRVAMEYSPNPYLSYVDGATVDLIRALGVEVVSSGNLLTRLLTEEQMQSQIEAGLFLDQTVEKAFDFIETGISEWDVQQFILREFKAHGYVTDEGPICAINEHSASPHYLPGKKSSLIKPGDWILIDLWAKKPGGIYADITRMGIFRGKPSEKQVHIFETVKRARDAALALIQERFVSGITGAEVDRCARDVIEKAGYGEFFTHRLGHNIDSETHGPGTHLDSYETHDSRLLMPFTCFSIEPGIYIPGEFGVRLECDVLIRDRPYVTCGWCDALRFVD